MRGIVRWLFQLAYWLDRHYLFQIPLQRWPWLLLVFSPLLALWRWMDCKLAVSVSALAALILATTGWARRRRDAIFEPAPLAVSSEDALPAVDEQIRGWAYGRFGVEGRETYLADVEAYLSYVPTREHVVMANVRQTSFLLLARSPAGEVGWWYAFFVPTRVRKVETGHVCWGLHKRPALAIHYLPGDGEEEETLYLAFADESTTGRVLADLQRDVPAQAFATKDRTT